MSYVILTGNIIDGMNIVGPFETHDDADEYASRYVDEWWIVELSAPQNLEAARIVAADGDV
jgi:hypothetical protein